MHFLALALVDIHVQEDAKKDREIKKEIDKLVAQKRKDGMSDLMAEFMIDRLGTISSAFSRAVDSAVADVMYPYWSGMEDPKYLEFDDRTEEFRREYEGRSDDLIMLPEGTPVALYGYPLYGKFTIRDGKVYEVSERTGGLEKRTKRAKMMKAMPACPYKKAYKDFAKFVEQKYGAGYNEETGGYGFYYNPNGVWDSCSLGGRWGNMFLVKDICKEYCTGRASQLISGDAPEAPEGYKWACAARKKDIQWDAMREWKNKKAAEDFRRYEQMFLNGKMDPGSYGTITPEGIKFCEVMIYRKGSSMEEYLKEHGVPDSWKYPVDPYNIADAHNWVSMEDNTDDGDDNAAEDENSIERWHRYIDRYIDGEAGDDAVLAAVDCHM